MVAIVWFVWGNGLFTRPRLGLTDVYFVPSEVSGTIVIVALDDASLSRYGRSPAQWSRSVYADLVGVLDGAGARVVGFDLLFSEETPEDGLLAEAIQRARQSTTRLRTVMAAAGVPPALPTGDLEAFPQAVYFENAMRPTGRFSQVIDYEGYVNTFPDSDGTVRRQPSIIQAADHPGLSWSLAVYLAYLRVPANAVEQVIEFDDGTLRIAQTRHLSVDKFGLWLQNYFGPPFNLKKHTFEVVSLVDILSGKTDPGTFKDRIVLIGLINSAGIADRYTVPSASHGQLMSGVEIQANAIESLLQNRPLRRLDRFMEFMLLGVLTLASSMFYMQLRWYFRFAAWLVLAGIGIAAAFVIFALTDQIISLFDGLLALTLPALLTTGIEITNEINRRRQSEFLLHSVIQVSQQRLVLDKILPHIAADIRRIVPLADITIWRCDLANTPPTLIYPPPEQNDSALQDLAELARKVGLSGECVMDRTRAALPLAWQRRQIGVLAVKNPHDTPISQHSIGLLRKLAEQLAPGLENAFLYTEIARQNAVQEAILTGSPAGILVLDRHFRVQRVNRAFAVIFNLSQEQCLRQAVETLLAAIDLNEHSRQDIEAALKKGESFRREIAIGQKTFNLDAAPQSQFGLWVVVITEITHLIQLSNLKTYMIRMLSHDLGNPLSRVLGYSQLLNHDRDSLSETQQQFVDYIIQDGEAMDRIINDVLNLEQLRSGEFTLEKVDLRQLILRLDIGKRPEMLLKQHTFAVKVPDSPVFIRGSYGQLAQAITNLLNNAIKYTPDGGHITVELSVEDNEHACLRVEDNGFGIPEAAQAKIFTEFYRVKSNATAGIGGTGLGLSLVKVVVEKHGGHVWFKSQEDMGSTFFIELPLLKEGFIQ